MCHVGIICPNTPGHINPMVALADALRGRGHAVTFFLLGDPPASVAAAGYEVVPLGGSVLSPDDYRAAIQALGALTGRAALRHTFAVGARATAAVLAVGPEVARKARVAALVVDQASFAGGTVADELGLPFVTVCNALLLNADPIVPPFFTHWRPRDTWWARLRNRLAWAALGRLHAPILKHVRDRRRAVGLPPLRRVADAWSARLQVSQQPETFEFPRRELPPHFHFAGPFRRAGGPADVPFPWDRLDGRPIIYASLGTLQNRVPETFRLIAEACAGSDTQLVLSTGRGVSPTALGELPGRPVVVQYAPQMELLARSALAVTHAGLNTVLEALGCGVPLVALPVTNDQPGVAARIAWVGAGEAIRPDTMTPETLRAAITRVRSDPAYRASVERIRDAIRASGGAARAAELIEQSLGSGSGNVA